MKYFPVSVVALILLVGVTTSVRGEGKLTYGDKCNVPNAILHIFTTTEVDDSEKCNLNAGLICTGTCTCAPTRVWDKGPLWGIFGGGSCIVGANGPCGKGDKCVSNARCGDNIPLCFCEDGYHAHDLQCISSSSHSSFTNGARTTTTSATAVISSLSLLYLLLRVLY